MEMFLGNKLTLNLCLFFFLSFLEVSTYGLVVYKGCFVEAEEERTISSRLKNRY